MSAPGSARPQPGGEYATITSRPDLLRPVLLSAGVLLIAMAAWLDGDRALMSAEQTAPAFVALAVVVAAGAAADRLGAFRLLAGVVLSQRVPAVLASTGVLVLTAVISAAVNLDVAAVAATPIAVRVASQRGLKATRLVIATALTANAASILLPTSNLTNLLVLDRSPIPTLEYLRQGWAAWLLVTVVTIAFLAPLIQRSPTSRFCPRPPFPAARPVVPTILDLLSMFVIASAVRALLGGGLTLQGGFSAEFVVGSLLAAGANNLPAAAAVNSALTTTPWPVIWAMAIGPNLLVTGSIATIICRRTALDLGVQFDSVTFSVLGAAMLPFQFVAACTGLALGI